MEKHPILKHGIWLLLALWVYTLTFIFNNYWSKYASYASVTKSFQQIVTSKERAFSNWIADTSLLAKLAAEVPAPSLLDEIQQLPFYAFIYDTRNPAQPLFWSSNAVLPDSYHVSVFGNGRYIKYGNGKYEFLKRVIQLNNKTITVIGLILLHEEFFIENPSLPKEFPGFKGLGGKMDITTEPSPYPVKGETGAVLAYFHPTVAEPIFIFNWASFIIQCLASFFLLVFISKFSTSLIRQKKVLQGLLFFVAVFFLLRYMVLRFDIPVDVSHLPLLDADQPGGKHSDELGRLMVNAFFALWFTSFVTRHTRDILQYLNKQKDHLRWAVIAFLSVTAVIAHFFLVSIIGSLYLNSAVAFDLTNFLSLNYTTILSFFILFLLCASHYMWLRFLGLVLVRLAGRRKWMISAFMGGVGLLILTISLSKGETIPLLFSLLWLLLFFAIGTNRRVKPAPATVGSTVVWLLVYAISLSLLLGFLGDNRLRKRTEDLTNSLVLKKNRTSERSMKIASSNIRHLDWWEIMTTCQNPDQCQAIKDTIIRRYLGGYLDRYSSGIYLFDRTNASINSDPDVTFESLNTLFSTQASPTGYPNLSYFSESFDKFGYIIKDFIRNPETSEQIGTLFVVVRSVGSGNLTFAPELFKQLQDFVTDLPQGFSYAWYKDGLLVEQYRNYPFPTNLPAAVSANQSLWENKTPEAYELWMNAGTDMVLALAGQRKMSISFISMLAYLFGAFLLFYLIMAGINLLLKGSFFSAKAFSYVILNLQNKIRITVIVILLLSFVIVAVVTISFFINQFKAGNEDQLAKGVQGISTDLTTQLPADFGYRSHREQKSILQELLVKISRTQNLDVNCFDSTGKMLATSQSIVFEKGVISPMLDPLVWWHLKKGQVHRYISDEKVGNLHYVSIYQPIRTTNDRIFGYLQVPYYVSQSELNQEISNFLVILINIIAFVFLLSGGLAFWISGNITKSFNIIAGKMDRIRLSERNERIVWNRNDEIGHLVSRYNKMVDQLEESAQMMARTERELAWREMARQVAHEIKNPLTPMKLSLQFLQKAIREKSADVNQITERVAGTLVGQIDHLSNIATEFSQFANLGNYKPEVFDLQPVLKDVVQLYEMQENVTVHWQQLPLNLLIKADKTQVNRLFTNLFQNAVEAGSGEKKISIKIAEELKPNGVVISFSDNGTGIPESVQPNIFRPNFTTKSAGTGLGLAICKAIVENAGGNISFTTEAGIGTSFYVHFPLAGVEA